MLSWRVRCAGVTRSSLLVAALCLRVCSVGKTSLMNQYVHKRFSNQVSNGTRVHARASSASGAYYCCPFVDLRLLRLFVTLSLSSYSTRPRSALIS
jgi:hypothetical protein